MTVFSSFYDGFCHRNMTLFTKIKEYKDMEKTIKMLPPTK